MAIESVVAHQRRTSVMVTRIALGLWVTVIVTLDAILIYRAATLSIGRILSLLAGSAAAVVMGVALADRLDARVELVSSRIYSQKISGRSLTIDLNAIRDIRQFNARKGKRDITILRIRGESPMSLISLTSDFTGFHDLRDRLLESSRTRLRYGAELGDRVWFSVTSD